MALRRPCARPRLALAVILAPGVALGLAGCGDDGVDPGQGTVPVPPPAVGPKNPGPPKGQLAVKPHIEDRVLCTPPEQPSDPRDGKCDPKAPSCGDHLYCLQLAQGNYCEPCPERDGIRHVFRERDFDAEHNRDPFQRDPFQPLTGSGGPKPPPGGKCLREDQLVASSYSYTDLKLVGIVAQGTQRKVLMTMGKDGFIIKRGDCVGKEKAVVKDIGLGYITFQGESDEYSVQLNPKQLLVNDPLLAPPARAPGAGSNGPGALAPPPTGTAPGASPPPAPAPPAPAPKRP